MSTDIPPQAPISPGERRDLRARAHPLHPVVMISSNGASPAVLAEIERALKRHELIKIRAMDADRIEREALLDQICTATGAQPVQHIGKILIVYRQNAALEVAPAQPARRAARTTLRRADTAGKRPARADGAKPSAPRRFVSAARRQLQRRKPSR